jgi:hypothetical protein
VQLVGADLLAPLVARATDAADQAEAAADSATALVDMLAEDVDVPAPVFEHIPAPANLVHFYGQSLSLGLATGARLSGAIPYGNALMPDSGVQDGAWTEGGAGLTGTASLATALVALNAATNSHSIEAPVVSAVGQLASRMRYADLIAANAGRGAFGIDGLKKGYNGGVGPYALLVDQFETYADILGAKPLRSSLCWMQGENDAQDAGTTKAGYAAALLDLVDDYATDTGQASVHLFTYQLSSHTIRSPGYNPNVGLALAELGETEDGVSCVLPLYFLPHIDGVHLTAASSRICGAYFGKAIDHYFRTGTKWEPMRPAAVARTGKVVTVTFSCPAGNVFVDTVTVTDPGNLGFEVFNGATTTVLPIESVYVWGNEAVITLVSVPSGPVQVGYALGTTLNGQLAGPTTGARGCLRDDDRTTAFFDRSVQLPNWCVMFRKAEGYGA